MTTTSVTPKTHSLMKPAAWGEPEVHYHKIRTVHVRSLFVDNPRRGERVVEEDVRLQTMSKYVRARIKMGDNEWDR